VQSGFIRGVVPVSDDDPPAEPGEPIPWLARLTVRERYALPAAGALGLAAGLWLGFWMVPDEALAVPTETLPHSGDVTAIYHPVPGVLPILTVVLLAVATWATWQAIQEPGGRWTAEESGGEEQ